MKTFQLVLLGIFGFFIVAGVIGFATFRGGSRGDEGPATAVLWGTLSEKTLSSALSAYRESNPGILEITYREIPRESFDAVLVEALASGTGPDLVLLPQDLILRHQNKITTIPFESYTERDFRDRFIDGADIFLSPLGITALPFSVDPMVMYFNRTLLANASVPQPPRNWDEFQSLTPTLSTVDASLAVRQSAVPFGEFNNVSHAKEILAMLIMQAGNPIIERNQNGVPSAVLASRFGKTVAPAESALRFYTEFSNPAKTLYTWNRALPNSTQAFLAGNVAFYPGFASELAGLRKRNPNLNFDVTLMPQVKDASARLTFGNMHGLAIMKNSKNISDAFRAAGVLSSSNFIAFWSDMSDEPPIRRDLLVQKPTDAFGPVFYESALITKAFLDPDPEGTESVFGGMVSDITSGRALVGNAVRDGDSQLERLLK